MPNDWNAFRNAVKAPAFAAIIVYFFWVAVEIITALIEEVSKTGGAAESYKPVEVTHVFLWYNLTLFNYTYQSYRVPRAAKPDGSGPLPGPVLGSEGNQNHRSRRARPPGVGHPVSKEPSQGTQPHDYYVDIWDQKAKEWLRYHYIQPDTCDERSLFGPSSRNAVCDGLWTAEPKSLSGYKPFSTLLGRIRHNYKEAHPNAHVRITAVEKMFENTVGLNGLIGGVWDFVLAVPLLITMVTHGAISSVFNLMKTAAASLIGVKETA